MPSLRDIRRKIKSVKSTEQITRAMKMVAAARMRRSQASILAARPFAVKMEGLIRDLAGYHLAHEPGACGEASEQDYFTAPPDGPVGLVLVTGDKGLCGAFNTTLARSTLEWLRGQPQRRSFLAVVGRKGRDFARRLLASRPEAGRGAADEEVRSGRARGFDLEVVTELAGIFPRVGFHHAEVLGQAVIGAYFQERLSRVDVIYNEFKSVAQQRLVRTTLLPVMVSAAPSASGEQPRSRDDGPLPVEFGFEPDCEDLLKALLPRHVKAQLYRILLESQAAELSARMNAMDSASKNAKELREALGMQANRQRQSMITNEIAELVGGAEALSG